MVKRLRHRPFTAVTGVRIPLGSLMCRCGSMAEQLICNQQVIGSTPTSAFSPFGPLAQLVRATGS